MKTLVVLAGGIVCGAAATFAYLSMNGGMPLESARDDAGEPEPLYWVAPMDSAYRRPQPGKSPMGMDLVPVYADAGADKGADEGLVRIASTVANNLGVRVDEVERRTLTDKVRSVGYVRYDEERLSHVHPRVSGWIEQLYVKSAGAQVETDAPLYTLYSPQLVSAQEELRLAVQRGAPDLIAASVERLESLQIPGDIIDRLRQGGEVERAVTFRATQSGVVDNLNVREGSFVEPDLTLMSIGALDPVWVEVEIFERDVHRIAEGLPVRMKLPYLPGREWVGTVDYIYPTLDARLRTLTLRLRFANTDRTLKPNMFAEVRIDTPPVTVLAVPREAVIRTGDASRVVREEAPGAYRSVDVHLGRVVGDYQEVLHGLSPGDRVVTSAQFLLDSESSKSAGLARIADRDAHDAMGKHESSMTADPGKRMSGHEGHDMSGHEGHDMSGHEGHDMAGGGQRHD